MTRILIRSGRPPHRPVAAPAAHAYRTGGTIATNSGNLLFQDAVYRTLRTPETELVVDSLSTERRGVNQAHIDRINSEFDLLVLPLANSFRPDFVTPLNRLSDVLEQLKLPVVVTSVGGQTGVDGDPRGSSAEVNEAAVRFVRAVLERSESIGVRGEFTKGYLEHLGFPADRIDIIGCPSLHLPDPVQPPSHLSGTLSEEARLAVNLTPSVPWMRTFLEHNHAKYDRLVYLPQDNETLGLLLWDEEFEAPPGFPGTSDHFLYREDRVRFFTEPIPWFGFLATQDFACGSRIHGNVAALLAGTPAFQLVHDSRTLELARFHQIPHLSFPTDAEVPAAELDAAALYEQCDLSGFNTVREQNRQTWFDFLERNRVPHRRTADLDFNQELADLAYPGPVGPLTRATAEDLAIRVRWLRQGRRGDELRSQGAYDPEFVPESTRVKDTQTRINALRTRVASQSEVISRQRRELAELKKIVARHSRAITALKNPKPKPTLRARISRRIRRFFGFSTKG